MGAKDLSFETWQEHRPCLAGFTTPQALFENKGEGRAVDQGTRKR